MKKALLSSLSFLILFASSVLFFPSDLKGQQQWTQTLGFGSSLWTDRASGVALDAAGNIYVTGSYTGVIDFGNGPLTAAGSTAAHLDGFVAKFSAAGVCQWSIRLNGPIPANSDQGLGIATNGTSVYVTGVFQTSLTVNGAMPVSGYGNSDGFGLKLDAVTGSTQWVTVFGGAGLDGSQAMCIDAAGNLYVGGFFTTNAVIPFATFGSFTRTSNSNGTDAFVGRIDGTTGAFTWVSTGGSPGFADNSSNCGLAYVPGLDRIVMTGSFLSTVAGTTATYSTVTPASVVTLTTSGGADICVLQLNASTGAFINGIAVGSSSGEEAIGAAYDPFSQYVVFTGYFINPTLTFGSNPPIIYSGGVNDDIYYAAYNPVTNNFAWSRSAGSTVQDRGQAISADGLGKVYVTGRYRSTMNAPTATIPLTVTSNRSTTSEEIFLLQVNSLTGDAEMLFSPQSNNVGTLGDIGNCVTADISGTVILGGMFSGEIIFSPLAPITSASATADVLIAKYAVPSSLPVRLQSFTAQRANTDITLAWHSASEIDHERFEIERSTDGRSFNTVGWRDAVGAPGSGNYSWTDLSAGSRNTGRIFYRLKMISTTGQVTYSEIVIVYLDRNNNILVVAASPNPFTDQLSLNLNLPERGQMQIGIIDMSGRKISSRMVDVPAGYSTMAVTETGILKKGVYTVTIEYQGNKKVMRVVKQ